MGDDAARLRKVNLVEVLSDAHPSCAPPPDDAPERWTEREIRDYFASGGKTSPAPKVVDDDDADDADDDDDAPPPPSTREDGKYLCQRVGCDAVYDASENAPGSCRHHPGAPTFHDGTKRWSCCGKSSHDFGEFMSFPGCATGRHTQRKPKKTRAAPAPAPALAPIPMPTSAEARARAGAAASPAASPAAACARCRQGFFCSDHAASAEAQAAYVAPTIKPPSNPAADTVVCADPDAVQICRNKGCGESYRERDNADDACLHHPGPPIFHERKKGWACCDVMCYDFDEFMSVKPCARGRHCAAPEAVAYAKKPVK